VDLDEVLSTAFALVLPHLNERQRRLVLGAVARALGRGGVTRVAGLAGSSRPTVRRGMGELEAAPDPHGRVRAAGAGPKPLRQADPGLVAALDRLVNPDTRGDPGSPLRWTTKSTRELAQTLTAMGHRVSAVTVGRLLRQEGYRLQRTRKTLEGAQHPDRDAQFAYLNEQARAYLAAGQPVVSVDTKKKELVGNYANGGAEWQPSGQPEDVLLHDFPDRELGKAIPYGVYDLAANSGWVSVGVDHDTAAFAVATLGRWWQQVGSATYPAASRLLVTADAGGSNGYRVRAWKTELARLAAETGLAVTVCHFPPGTSKWNRIEHRLFSHISMNWRGRPLESHQVIVELIGATTTRAGLRVRAEVDRGVYPLGVKVSDQQLAAVPLQQHDWHGDWNYTIAPRAPSPSGASTGRDDSYSAAGSIGARSG
jgi:Rhodopirellula transposase DDE domain